MEALNWSKAMLDPTVSVSKLQWKFLGQNWLVVDPSMNTAVFRRARVLFWSQSAVLLCPLNPINKILKFAGEKKQSHFCHLNENFHTECDWVITGRICRTETFHLFGLPWLKSEMGQCLVFSFDLQNKRKCQLLYAAVEKHLKLMMEATELKGKCSFVWECTERRETHSGYFLKYQTAELCSSEAKTSISLSNHLNFLP